MKVKIKLINGGKLPVFKHEGDACCDCYARLDSEVNIEIGKRKRVKLGFALALPDGYEALVRPRSGLSDKSIDVCLGTVDASYRGELEAEIVNNSDTDIYITDGDRICQLAIREAPAIQFEVCKELDETERGANGFGSTGV